MIKKENGITLIALIITIIVMLILVLVTISMATNGGLFDYAGRGTVETEIATDKDRIMAAMGAWGVEKWSGEKTLVEVLSEDFGLSNVVEIENGAEVTMASGRTYIVLDDGTIEEKIGVTLSKRRETLKIIGGNEMPYVDLIATLNGVSGTITWQNSDTDVVEISASEGTSIRVTAKAVGSSTITASCSGKSTTCSITVKESQNINSYISNYVNYDCVTGVNSSYLSYQSPSTLNGYQDQTIIVDTTKDENNKSIIRWKLLGKDENDQILLIAADTIAYTTNNTTTRYSFGLQGQIGFVYGPDELNKICGMYGHGQYADTTKYTYSYNGTNIATGGRSVVVEDVNKVLGYTPNPVTEHAFSKNADDGYIYYDGTKGDGDYTTFIYYNEANNTWVTLGSGESVNIPNTYYSYSIGSSNNKSRMIRFFENTTSNSNYWLASRSLSCNTDGHVDNSIRRVVSGGMYGGNLFYSHDESKNYTRGVRPVVTLAPNVSLIDQDESGAWNLGIE